MLPRTDILVTEAELSTVRREVEEGPVALSGFAAVMANGDVRLLPPELSALIQRAVQALATNGSVSIGSLPEELTSNTAADVLGVSRPTLLKLAKSGQVASFKVGSHTRFQRDDVLEFKARREQERRRALSELLDLEDQLDEYN